MQGTAVISHRRGVHSGGDVVVLWSFVCTRLPSSYRKEGHGCAFAGALPRGRHGLCAGEVLPVRSTAEGAALDFVECSEPRAWVLCVRQCNGEQNLIFLATSSVQLFAAHLIHFCSSIE